MTILTFIILLLGLTLGISFLTILNQNSRLSELRKVNDNLFAKFEKHGQTIVRLSKQLAEKEPLCSRELNVLSKKFYCTREKDHTGPCIFYVVVEQSEE